MKKFLATAILLLTIVISSNAQVELTSSGTGAAYTLGVPGVFSLRNGIQVTFKAHANSSAAATMNVSGTGAVSIMKDGGSSSLTAGDIKNGQIVTLAYDGAKWQMMNPVGTPTAPTNYWSPNGSDIFNNNAGNVGIGTTPATKLDVANSTLPTTSRFSNTFSSAGSKMAVYGWATGGSTGDNLAGAFDAYNSTGTNFAVYGAASGNFGNKTAIFGNATGTGGTNTAGYFSASGGTNNYAIIVPSASGNVGIGTTNPPALLTVGNTNGFRVGQNGDITRIFSVTYTWPTSQGVANSVLTNNGSGALTWETVSSLANAWSLTGNAISGGNQLGTTNAFDLSIIAGGNAAITIDDVSQNIGIGAAPSTLYKIYTNIPNSNTTSHTANEIQHNYSGASTKTGVSSIVSADGSGLKRSFYGFASAAGTQETVGFYSVIDNDGSGSSYGVYNDFSLSTSTANQEGMRNIIDNAGTSFKRGVFTSINQTGGANGSDMTGVHNSITSSSSASQDMFGVINQLTNNSTTGSTYGIYQSFSGTSTGTKYGFYASGEDQNYFSGNVGIGTASPTATLHVQGGARITDLVGPGTVITDANGNLSVAAGTTITGSGTTSYLARWTPSGSQLGIGATFDNGTNVGIGTAVPAKVAGSNRYLTVSATDVGTTNATASVELVGNAGALNTMASKIDFLGVTPVTDAIYTRARIESRTGNGATGHGQLLFYTFNGTFNEAMRIRESGHIGIGGSGVVGSPLSVGTSNQFQVDANGNLIRINNVPLTWPAANGAGFLSNNGSGTLTWSSAGVLAGGTTNYVPKWTSANSLSSTSLIFDNGNVVGIGTATPSASRLNIHTTSGAGNLRLTSAATLQSASDGFSMSNDGSNIMYMTQHENDDWYFNTNGGTLGIMIKPTGNVGIGTATVNNKLDVEGAAVIGANYSGTNTAPTNGLLVEGNVGIGTTSSSAKAAIYGSTDPLLLLDGPTGAQSPLVFATAGTNKWAWYVPGGGANLALWHYGAPNQNYINFDGTNGHVNIAPAAGNVGVGVVATPINKLDVEGAVAIGAAYSGASTAPTNGLLVEGMTGIGVSSGLTAKLDVANSATTWTSGQTYANTIQGATYGTSYSNRGVMGVSWSGATATYGIGIYGSAAGAAVNNYGVYGNATGGTTNYAGYFDAGNVFINNRLGINDPAPSYELDVSSLTTTYAGRFRNTGTGGADGLRVEVITAASASAIRYGTYSIVSGGLSTQYGIIGQATTSGTTNYGVYASASGATTNWAGYFVGNSFTTAGAWTPSDEKLKTNISLFDGALAKIDQLPVKTYNFNRKEYAELNLPTQKQYGIMAQDLQAIFPEMVLESVHNIPNPNNDEATNDFTIKAVNYSQLIPVLVRAIQEQQEMINNLKREVDSLKNK